MGMVRAEFTITTLLPSMRPEETNRHTPRYRNTDILCRTIGWIQPVTSLC